MNKLPIKIKFFLLLSGLSAAGFFLFVLLHNLVSGFLSTIFNKEIEEPVFFFLAIIVCPLGFLVGIVGSTVLFFKERSKL